MRVIFAILTVLAAAGATMTIHSDASAQATCRQKCTEQEKACLKRTNNKSQCGTSAQACLAKCK